ncbi:MAG: spore germination protein [Clostridiales bacterium]|jgi:spore germination protein KA|nr:spore germination protein [Clostridiales bacterium]
MERNKGGRQVLFGFMKRKLRYLLSSSGQAGAGDDNKEKRAEQHMPPELSTSLDENVEALKNELSDGSDVKVHRFRFGPDLCYSGALVFIDGMTDSLFISEAILRPIVSWRTCDELPKARDIARTVSSDVICAGEVQLIASVSDCAASCLSGDAVFFADGCPEALQINAKGYEKRSVTEPASESVVRGPREGFTENLRTNTALLRRKIRSGRLRCESLTVGKRTQTHICLMYIDGIADKKVIETLKFRIKGLDVDSILESGYIEQYIEDAPLSPFSTVGYSEKPDVIAGRVLEGRVAVIIDGTPFVLTVPMLFVESFQTAEDYYSRPMYATMMRIVRYLAYIIAVFAPAIYISLTSFHHEMIPTTLLLTIAKAREGTPFPVFLETFIMVISFEILREGGIRLPRPVGQAISIVGALIMGDAAVSAGIVGAPVVITIAITAVASFLIPMQNESDTMLRLAMMALAAFAGFYGVAMGTFAILIHLATLTSFGAAYFDGFAWTRNLQDSIIRMPLWTMKRRPKHIAKGDTVRIKSFIPPLRPHAGESNRQAGDD